MLTPLPRSSQAERGSLLIASVSGRALARSALRAGLTPLVADFFADADTQDMAFASRKLDGDISHGMRAPSLFRALGALAELAPSPILGLAYGAGFEDRPELLTLIARRWPLLGNDAATVMRLKSPESFFAELDRLCVPHPATASERPEKGGGWLAKRIGGAGGSHIVPSRLKQGARNVYYQERVEGSAVSALFVANQDGARVLGFSEQWTAPSPRSPWRYGGAVRPAALPHAVARQMASAVIRIARSFEITGLASADFMVNGTEALLLEINPRPGATLDIFDGGATPLLRLHLEAVREGKLPRSGLKFSDAMASAIVYAETGITVPPGRVWPDWSADRPKPSEWIDKNRPICTVWARGSTILRAKRLVEERICKVRADFQSMSRGDNGEQKRRNRRGAPKGVAKRQRQGGADRQSSHR
jgi:predicted ATP-grasp superfamily ATP-dependent carboligase